jgi:integral membrane protein (TIGR01906 family)
MKIIELIFRWIFILCIPILLATTSLRIPANCPYMYEYLFNKYQVGNTTGLDTPALKATARGLVDYFNSSEEYIHLVVQKNGQSFTLFNEREMLHLKDVKYLFWLDLWVLSGTAIFILIYVVWSMVRDNTYRQLLARSALTGAGLTFGLMIVLGIGMLFNFDALLWRFHLISFSNDLWLLDPNKDYLIMLIPNGFMYDASFTVAGAVVIGALITGSIGGGYLLSIRNQKKSS